MGAILHSNQAIKVRDQVQARAGLSAHNVVEGWAAQDADHLPTVHVLPRHDLQQGRLACNRGGTEVLRV